MVAPLYVLIDRMPSSGMKDPEVYRYNPTDLTKMMGERFQLHLCWVRVGITPRHSVGFDTLWESDHDAECHSRLPRVPTRGSS